MRPAKAWRRTERSHVCMGRIYRALSERLLDSRYVDAVQDSAVEKPRLAVIGTFFRTRSVEKRALSGSGLLEKSRLAAIEALSAEKATLSEIAPAPRGAFPKGTAMGKPLIRHHGKPFRRKAARRPREAPPRPAKRVFFSNQAQNYR